MCQGGRLGRPGATCVHVLILRPDIDGRREAVVPGIWLRLAADITHVAGLPFLTVVDCGSSFIVWQRLGCESAGEFVLALRRVFRQRDDVSESGDSGASRVVGGEACAQVCLADPGQRVHGACA